MITFTLYIVVTTSTFTTAYHTKDFSSFEKCLLYKHEIIEKTTRPGVKVAGFCEQSNEYNDPVDINVNFKGYK